MPKLSLSNRLSKATQGAPSTVSDSDAARFRHMDRRAHLADKQLHQSYVTTMFNVVAPRYDDFTRWFSFGMDSGWKRELVSALRATIRPDSTVVDLACGTGDLALTLAPLVPRGLALGLDASPNMIGAARQRLATFPLPNCRFVVGDMTQIPLPDASADIVTIGYGLRNVAELDGALREIARILKPDGCVAALDFVQPPHPAWRAVFLGYLRAAGWAFGIAWHGNGKTYSYISESIRRFVSLTELKRRAGAMGLVPVYCAEKLLGGISLILWTRSAADSASNG